MQGLPRPGGGRAALSGQELQFVSDVKLEVCCALRTLCFNQNFKFVAEDIPDLCLQIRFLTGDGWHAAWRCLIRLVTKIESSLQLDCAVVPSTVSTVSTLVPC